MIRSSVQRVVVVIGSLGGGGAERVAVDLCRSLSVAGKHVTLLTLTGDDPDVYTVPSSVRRERLEIRRPATSTFDTIQFSLSALAKIRRRILSLNPNVVVSLVEQTNTRVAASLIGTGVPLIISERTHPGRCRTSKGWALARRIVYRRADAVVVQTSSIADWFIKSVTTRRLVVIPNAVRALEDFQSGRGSGDVSVARPNIVAIGRLTKEKGFDLLIEAFARSGLASDSWRLIILGEGEERAALRAQAEVRDIGRSLEMPGHVRGVGPWLQNADIFALSSRYEGFPNALVEALQIGCASISFDCESGPSELIENEKNGLLVPPGDVDALMLGLRRLASDAELRKRLSAAAMESTNARFDRAKIYGKWADLIDSISLGARGSASFSSTVTAPDNGR